MAQWLIVWRVRIIILENRKCFWISYLNSNTFHVEIFVRFKSMQKLFKFIFKHFSNSLQTFATNRDKGGICARPSSAPAKNHLVSAGATNRDKRVPSCPGSWLQPGLKVFFCAKVPNFRWQVFQSEFKKCLNMNLNNFCIILNLTKISTWKVFEF